MGEELSKVKKAVPYQCVIIGKSGAGKSTLLNWLNGTAYEEKRTASGNRYLEVLPGSEPGIVQTGHATQSETVLPNVLAVGSNMMVDCPGFFDTREGIVNIGNALNIKQIVTGNVKVLVIVNVNNLYGDRGHFQELLKLLDIFGQEFLKTGSYLIILNKGNEYTYDESISRIKEIVSGQEAYAPIREFMGHIINRIRKVNLLTTKQNDGLGAEELDIDVDDLKRHEFGLSERTVKPKKTTIDSASAQQQVQVKEPTRYILNAELSHMPRYSGPINVALDPKDQKQVDQMTQGLIHNVKTELLNKRKINHEVILLNYGMLVRLQGLLDNTMSIVDDQISQSFISIQRQISGLVKEGHFVKARELLACLEQLRRALQRDDVGRVFIHKVNVAKYYWESREELDKAQAAQKEIEDRKKEVARLKQQQEAEQRERARLEADIKALQQKGSLSEGEVKTLKEKVDQLQRKLIDMVPSGGVVTKDEHARTQALLEETQLQLQRLQDERKQAEEPRRPIQQARITREAFIQKIASFKTSESSRFYQHLIQLFDNDSSLRSLNLTHWKVGNKGAEALAAALQYNSRLTELYLGANQIGDTGAQALATALHQNSSLTKLSFAGNPIENVGAKALAAALQTNSILKELSLWGCPIGDLGAQALATALQHNTTLRELELGCTQIGKVSAQAFAIALQTNSSLNILNLNGNQIGPVGAQALATALHQNSSLRELILFRSQIGDAGAQAIATALHTNKTLTQLHLDQNQIGDESARAFVSALQTNSTLRVLYLGQNEIGDVGAQALAHTLNTNSSLRELYLHNNRFGDESARAFASALQTNSTMTVLKLKYNSIGDALKSQLKQDRRINIGY